MKRYWILLFSLALISAHAQNCLVTSVGLPPLNDLGTGYWNGSQGGLYSNGSNYRTASHNAAGLNIASQIMPLDTSGNIDVANGKIVWLSIGMSNTTQETQAFLPMANSFPGKNPKLVLVDGAQGGQDIDVIINPNANFWTVINQRLATNGLTNRQVQVVWFKQAEAGPNDSAFASYPDSLKLKFKRAIQLIKDKFPRARLCYMSSRIYAGYATTQLNPEPYAWYSGWSVKRLIEDQVNGDTSLTYTGINARAPWLAWGPYLWADGTTPRSDGLTWLCPTDYSSDGTHPSTAGRQKVAQLLLDFFTTDSTTTPWFLDSSTGIKDYLSSDLIRVYPNPAHSSFAIFLREEPGIGNWELRIFDVTGREVFYQPLNSKQQTLNPYLSVGLYYVQVTYGKKVFKEKLVVE
jgi:hypothetical protein